MALTRKQRRQAAQQNGKGKDEATQVDEPKPEPEETPESRSEKQAKVRFLHTLREKHIGRDEELDELAKKADALDVLQCMLRDEMLSEEGYNEWMHVVAGNNTIIRGRRQLRDGKNFPPGSTRRRSMRLNCIHKELQLIAGMDVSDEDRQILQDLAKVRWAFVSMDHIEGLEIGSEKYQAVMDDKHEGIQSEMKIQSLWNAADVGVIALTAALGAMAFIDGGMTAGAAAKAAGWAGVGYAGHKAIKHRDDLAARFQDFASTHGMSKLQARKAYANGMAGTE